MHSLPFRPRPRKIAAGFLLLQLSLAMTVAMVMATIGLWKEIRAMNEEVITGQADNLATLSAALGNYQTTYFDKLTAGQSIDGFANPLAPTISELNSSGFLINFSSSNLYGGTYTLNVQTVPVAGSLAGVDLKGLTCLTTAITNPSNGRLDTPLLGAAITRAGGNSGYSNAASPAIITGLNGGWTETNPVMSSSGSPIAGILCMRSGYGSTGLLQFTRRDGTMKPTGAWDMAGQNVTNINNLGSTTLSNTGAATIGGLTNTNGIGNTGNITNSGMWTNNGNATVGGTLGVSGQANMNGISNNGNIANTGTWTNSGNATVGGTLGVTGQTTMNGIDNRGSISNTGNVTANMMQLNGTVTAGNGCSQNGMQARTNTGSVISCVAGIWTPPASTGGTAASCSATSVTFGAGCRGTLTGTTSGTTQSATMTYGSGSANYSCSNGSWSFLSGSCTLPPANCNSQVLSWSGSSASCSGTSPTMSSGQVVGVYSTNGNDGSVTASCSNGTISMSSPVCTIPMTTYNYPTDLGRNFISFNPNNLAVYCQYRGKNAVVASSVSKNAGSNPLVVCGNINAKLECQAYTNCTSWPSGCFIIEVAACTP